MAEILALGAVATGANALSRAVTGKDLVEHGKYLAGALCEKLMGTAGDKAGSRVAGMFLTKTEREARLKFKENLDEVIETLSSLATSSAVEDENVRSKNYVACPTFEHAAGAHSPTISLVYY